MLEVLLENEFGHIELYELAKGLQALRFVHQKGQGSVSLYGGQVLSWQPQGQQPVFWLSETSHYRSGKAIRGGVPLCWPWFGGEVKLPNGELHKVSNHGFARQSQWQVADIKLLESGVEITLSLTGEQLSPHWPGAFELTQTLVFDESFVQTLTMKNLSQQTLEYTGALHSYFCVGNAQETQIPALNDLVYDDKLSGSNGQQSVLKNCLGPTDRIYHSNNSMVIVDHKWRREIEVSSQGCQQWVLWNPGEEAKTIADLHADGENEFICLEAANTHWQAIASQTSVSISQTIKLKAIG
ncbi:D-hexose-6-phosphate mutarotase [Colwellia sp. MB02u-18]|uniref:D-hexose-6-phosphate mutarotase n=1 Tax=unclassified Colwellia TaxID=196834 RepID=UPI0015F3AA3D|nr:MULTISPECIES: D-hexose-6-phosphate mutarotase [unclassified Colwellia]MBA6223287.1 D-hexose-6-phosphate mutarotase [Colwellia sp. MB3u-45]MBA6266431.1 D-hexose-6-phosphate mutarotase [Colwellia sp. MB3u-43]MBA6322446.1 D-hexose-6-phosphate mutarotase [Colwellia sp. MB02u-19]MBA6324445.1 D-hexose-6-phosphate mutarotase [Colwellia sp. MB02u-18]MBA6330101.1 D-hexose-6-phosphate mutarotase [Colwellia sp. MB02u-12]